MKIDEFENSVDANEAAHDDKPPHLGLHYLQIQHFFVVVFGNCQNIGIFVVFFSIKFVLKSLISQYGYSFLHFFLFFFYFFEILLAGVRLLC